MKPGILTPGSGFYLLDKWKNNSCCLALGPWVRHLTSLGLKLLLYEIKVNNTIAKPLCSSNILWYKFKPLKILDSVKINILPFHLILQLESILFYFILLLDVSINKHFLNSYWMQMMAVSWGHGSNDCAQSEASWVTILVGHGIII